MDAFWEEVAAELRSTGLEVAAGSDGVQIWLPRQDHVHHAAIWGILLGVTSAVVGTMLSPLLPMLLLYPVMALSFGLTAAGMLMLLGLALADLVWWLALPVMRRARSHRLSLTHAAISSIDHSYPLEDIDDVDIQRTWGLYQLVIRGSGARHVLTSSPNAFHLRPIRTLILEQRAIRREHLERSGHDLSQRAQPPEALLSLGKR